MEKEKIINMLEAIDNNLVSKQQICLIGSSVLILLGMPLRYTMDLDNKNIEVLKEAVLKAGFLFDPDDYFHSDDPYIQIVKKDFVHMPGNDQWQKNLSVLWQGNNLTIFNPPLEVLAASKLAAGRDNDFDDIEFLFTLDKNLKSKIETIKLSFSLDDQQNIDENMIVIEVSQQNFFQNKENKNSIK